MNKWNTIVPSRDVGLAFTLVCDRGFATGLCTHRHAAMGHLVWMAEAFLDTFPTADDVSRTVEWRWPVFYPLGVALRSGVVDRVGRISIPVGLKAFPTMRGGGGGQPWREYHDGRLQGLGPTTTDRDLPIKMIVNHEMLKEMLVSGWRPADRW